MDPIADQAHKRNAEAQAKKKKAARAESVLLSPAVLKWTFVGALAALFLAGLLIQFQSNKTSEMNDPAAAMRREMGLMDLEGNTFVPTSEFEQQFAKIQSSDPDMRIEGMNGILAENRSGALPVIRGLLGDGDPKIRERAAQLLGENKAKGFANSLVTLLIDPVPEVRAAAAGSLKAYTDEPGVLYLLTTPMNQNDPTIALNALEVWKAFSRTDEASAVRVLVEAFRSTSDEVVIAAMNAGANGLTTDYLRSVRGEYQVLADRRAGSPVGDEAARLVAFIDTQTGGQ